MKGCYDDHFALAWANIGTGRKVTSCVHVHVCRLETLVHEHACVVCLEHNLIGIIIVPEKTHTQYLNMSPLRVPPPSAKGATKVEIWLVLVTVQCNVDSVACVSASLCLCMITLTCMTVYANLHDPVKLSHDECMSNSHGQCVQ